MKLPAHRAGLLGKNRDPPTEKWVGSWGKISSIGQRYNGGTIGYGAVFDKFLFKIIFYRLSMLSSDKFLMG